MTVVVTGACGHIGANLVRALIEKGRPVRALIHNDQRALTGLGIETVKGDICDPESLYRAFTGAEVVYHLAANISLMMNDWSLLHKVNVIGTRNVVDACIKSGVKRLVHFSSIEALAAAPDDEVINESCSLVDSKSCPPYDRSKADSEREIHRAIAQGLDTVIINPTAIIGPYDYQPSHFGTVLLALANHKLPALVAGGFDWVDARDVAEGAINVEQSAPTGARYLLSGQYVSIRDVATIVETITGVPAPQFICPMWLARAGAPIVTTYNRITGGRPLFTEVSLTALNSKRLVSHEKATREIGYQPRPFRQTLIDTLHWFEDSGRFIRPLKKAEWN
jgi:dihydroflavonol-4-reductase